MPQGNLPVNVGTRPLTSAYSAFKAAPQVQDVVGATMVGKGTLSALNKTATAGVLIKATPGRICKVIVNTAASAAGCIYDSNVAGIAAGTLIFAIPQTVGIYDVDFPCETAISLVVGTAGVVSLSYQ
jgi:hypothetical protein